MRKERGKECEKFKFFASMPTNSRRSSAGEEQGEEVEREQESRHV